MYNKKLGTHSLQRSLEKAAMESKYGSSKFRDRSEKHITFKHLNIRIIFCVTSHTDTYNTQSFSDSPQITQKPLKLIELPRKLGERVKIHFYLTSL